jgi:outer membrane cobalamin receptor
MIAGHEMPGLFHFGGIKSSYNSQLIDRFDLYAGGFGAQYGLATGGVVDIGTRAPRTDRWAGYADLSMIDLSALAQGPITNDLSVAVAASPTIDLLMKAADANDMIDDLTFTTYPVYYDYQFKLQQRLDQGTIIIIAVDSLAYVERERIVAIVLRTAMSRMSLTKAGNRYHPR